MRRFHLTPSPAAIGSSHLTRRPSAGLIFDRSVNLYGVTEAGGSYNLGTVFELSPATGGGWSETVLHDFGSLSGEGIAPLGSLISDPAGNLYGTTDEGGTTGYGLRDHTLGSVGRAPLNPSFYSGFHCL